MSEPLKLTEIQSGHFLGFRPHPRRRQRHVGSQVRRRASAFADERSAHAATARRIDRPAAAARAILIWSRTRFRQPIASDMREPVVEVQGLVVEHLRGSFFSCELIGRPGHRVDHAHFGDDVPIQHQCAAGDVVGIVLDSYDQTRGQIIYRCQSASDRAPRSASKGDPLVLRFERLAFAPSELVGVAETGRARVDV